MMWQAVYDPLIEGKPKILGEMKRETVEEKRCFNDSICSNIQHF